MAGHPYNRAGATAQPVMFMLRCVRVLYSGRIEFRDVRKTCWSCLRRCEVYLFLLRASASSLMSRRGHGHQ